MQNTEFRYCACRKPARYIYHVRHADSHYFCAGCAMEKTDFPSGTIECVWGEIPAHEIAPPITLKHPTEVGSFHGSLGQLSERVHGMRYDMVEEFYRCSAEELHRQAAGDRVRGRDTLAALLEESAELAKRQCNNFARIWALCKPHAE